VLSSGDDEFTVSFAGWHEPFDSPEVASRRFTWVIEAFHRMRASQVRVAYLSTGCRKHRSVGHTGPRRTHQRYSFYIRPTEPLVKVGEKNFRIARDGSPLSISLDQQGGHQIVLRCWNQELARPPGQRQYDWRFEITVPNGGLIVRKDAFEFEAPEGGYLRSDSVDMAATLGNHWRSSAERSYFLRFDDETFGRVELEMQAGGDHFVVWESFLNPKAGSRNLETTAN
jgi:hypothetical protein